MTFNIPTVSARVASYHERVRPHVRQPDATLEAYAWPGGYPLYYLTADNRGHDVQVACPACATKAHEYGCTVTHAEANWEDPDLICGNCNERIESAYAEEGGA